MRMRLGGEDARRLLGVIDTAKRGADRAARMARAVARAQTVDPLTRLHSVQRWLDDEERWCVLWAAAVVRALDRGVDPWAVATRAGYRDPSSLPLIRRELEAGRAGRRGGRLRAPWRLGHDAPEWRTKIRRENRRAIRRGSVAHPSRDEWEPW